MKKALAILMTFAFCFGILSFAFATEPEAAVPDGYTGIYTAEDLDNIRNNLSGKYILMNDIDLSSYENWNPIGSGEAPFTGELDGNGYAVENMTVTANQDEKVYAGLFGFAQNALIENLTIENGTIDVYSSKGVCAGLICAECVSTSFFNSTVNGTVTATGEDTMDVGGIIGAFFVSGNENSEVGYCSNYAAISSSLIMKSKKLAIDYNHIGGILGFSTGKIKICRNSGNITSTTTVYYDNIAEAQTGGICGNTNGLIYNCYNTANIKANGNAFLYAGGIAGLWNMVDEISNVYNTGIVSADETESSYASAILGYALGLPTPDEANTQQTPFLSNAYYLDNMDTAFADIMNSWVESRNIVKLTEEDFKNQNSFLGFDFESIWEMDEELGRPVLREKTNATPTPTNPTEKFLFEKIYDKILAFVKWVFTFILF